MYILTSNGILNFNLLNIVLVVVKAVKNEMLEQVKGAHLTFSAVICLDQVLCQLTTSVVSTGVVIVVLFFKDLLQLQPLQLKIADDI